MKLHEKDRKATLLETGETVVVYRSSQRDSWISSEDFRTEYKPSELKFSNE